MKIALIIAAAAVSFGSPSAFAQSAQQAETRAVGIQQQKLELCKRTSDLIAATQADLRALNAQPATSREERFARQLRNADMDLAISNARATMAAMDCSAPVNEINASARALRRQCTAWLSANSISLDAARGNYRHARFAQIVMPGILMAAGYPLAIALNANDAFDTANVNLAAINCHKMVDARQSL